MEILERIRSEKAHTASKQYVFFPLADMRYICKKCGNELIEEFTLTDVFIDDG